MGSPRNRECSRRQLVGCSSPSLGGRASDHPTLEEPAPDGLGVRSKPVADAGNPRAIRESTKDHPSPLHNYLTRGFSRFGRLERPENHRVRIPLPPPSQNSSDKALCESSCRTLRSCTPYAQLPKACHWRLRPAWGPTITATVWMPAVMARARERTNRARDPDEDARDDDGDDRHTDRTACHREPADERGEDLRTARDHRVQHRLVEACDAVVSRDRLVHLREAPPRHDAYARLRVSPRRRGSSQR